jgi:hypothetical protein
VRQAVEVSPAPWNQLLALAKDALQNVEMFLTNESITRRELRTIMENLEEIPKFIAQAKKQAPPPAKAAFKKAELAVSRMLFDIDQMTGLADEGLQQAQFNARKWANEARKQIEIILNT